MIALALALASSSAAAADPIACSDDGPPIYTRDSRTFPLGEPFAPSMVTTTSLVISATGHWRRTTRFDAATPKRVTIDDGCLDPMRLAELRRALGRARWRATMPRINCRALASVHVVYASPARGVKVERDEPCQAALDPGTDLLVACADEVTDWTAADGEIAPRCRGVDAPP